MEFKDEEGEEEENDEVEEIIARLRKAIGKLRRLVENKGTEEEKKEVQKLGKKLREAERTASKELISELTQRASTLIETIKGREKKTTQEKEEEVGIEEEEEATIETKQKVEKEKVKADSELSGGLKKIRGLLEETFLPAADESPSFSGEKSVKEAGEIMEAIEKEERRVPPSKNLASDVQRLKEEMNEFKTNFRNEINEMKEEIKSLKSQVSDLRSESSERTPSSTLQPSQMKKQEEEINREIREKIKRTKETLSTEPHNPLVYAVKVEALRVTVREILASDESIPQSKKGKLQQLLDRLQLESETYQQKILS